MKYKGFFGIFAYCLVHMGLPTKKHQACCIFFIYIGPRSVVVLHDKRPMSSLKSVIFGKKIDEKLVGFFYQFPLY